MAFLNASIVVRLTMYDVHMGMNVDKCRILGIWFLI